MIAKPICLIGIHRSLHGSTPMIRGCWFALGLVCLVAPVTFARAPAKPNVLVILADDLGYGELGCQGFSSEIPTPNIDSIAHNGVRFTSGYVSGPYCSPTRAGFMTGRYQTRFGHEFNPGPVRSAAEIFGLSLKRNHDRRPTQSGWVHRGLVRKIASRLRAAISSTAARIRRILRLSRRLTRTSMPRPTRPIRFCEARANHGYRRIHDRCLCPRSREVHRPPQVESLVLLSRFQCRACAAGSDG